MRTYRYWASLEAELPLKEGSQKTRILAGSNASEAEAQQEAQRRLAWVQARIQGHEPPLEAYEVDIRETVLETPAEDAVVTRNRYGAHVLNCATLPILDIDEPPRRLWDLFARKTPAWRQARMEAVLTELAAGEPRLGFRLYATAKGFRVVVLGADLEPKAPRMARLARRLNVDALYWTLCLKQGCYRARLTPKPSRIGCPTIRVPFPPTPDQAAQVAAWEETYAAHAGRYATCRFLRAFGPEPAHPLVKLHDTRTGAHSERRLG